jgi:hypothetical protein
VDGPHRQARPGDAADTRRGPDEAAAPVRLTGWLAEWPASTVLNVIYALLIEHASQEQIDDLDRRLDADLIDESDDIGPDELADILAEAVAFE